jgi:hypothetical protein
MYDRSQDSCKSWYKSRCLSSTRQSFVHLLHLLYLYVNQPLLLVVFVSVQRKALNRL